MLIAVDLSEPELQAIEDELDRQANALPRVDIVRGAIAHSLTLVVKTIEEAMELSNFYAPEHLILQVADAVAVRETVENAGSVFVGPWTPESVGDYSAGVNHSLRKFSLFLTLSNPPSPFSLSLSSFPFPCPFSPLLPRYLSKCTDMMINSNIRLRKTILRRQLGIIRQTHHQQ